MDGGSPSLVAKWIFTHASGIIGLSLRVALLNLYNSVLPFACYI